MKKVYLMLLMALMAVAASAQDLYLRGEMNGWGASNDWKFSTTDNNTYILEGVDVSAGQQFQVADNSWSTQWGNGGQISMDTPTVINGKSNMTLRVGGEGLTFTFVKSTSTLTVTNPSGGGDDPVTPVAQGIYFRGERNNWLNGNDWNNRAQWKFKQSEEDPNVYTLLLADVQGGRAFCIFEETSGIYYKGHSSIEYDREYTLVNSNPDLTLKQGGNNVLFTYNYQTKVLKVENDVNDDPVEEVHEMYLVGDMNDWQTSDDWKFTKREAELTYVLKGKEVSADQKFTVYCKTDDQHWYQEEPIILEKNYTLTGAGTDNHMHLAAAGTNLTFTFNKLNNRLVVESEDPVSVEVPSNGVYTVYFDNDANWENVSVWIWDQNHSNKNYTGGVWPGSAMTFDPQTGYYTYSVKVDDDNPFMKVIFNDGTNGGQQTHNFVMYDNGIYNSSVFTDSYVTETVDPSVEGNVTIYFNAGADLFDASKMNNNAPYIQAWSIADGKFVKLGANDTDAQMTLVEGRDALFMYEIKNAEKYKGVQFFAPNNNNETIYWNGRTATAFDADEWATFIYGTGNGTAPQSYMTFEELEDLRSGDKANIYFIGDGIGQTTAWDQENLLSVNDVRDGQARGWLGDGVYVRAFSKLDGNGGKFKMSSVNPKSYREEHGQVNDNHRWWATFNLGIVGFIGDPNQVNREDDDENGYVEYKVNEVEEYRNYNQYDWKFTFPSDGTVDEYYLIIDSEYHTTALIPFKPAPTLKAASVGTFQKRTFSEEETGEYSKANSGRFLKGTATSGEARLDHYNSAAGTAEILVSEGVKENLWGNGYNVFYGLYNDGDLVTGFDGHKDADRYELSIANMVAGENTPITLRCTYTEPQGTGGLKFRSLAYDCKVKAEEMSFPSLTVDENSIKSALFADKNGWHLAVSFDTNPIEETEALAMYPDFKVTTSAGNKVSLVHKEHSAVADFDFINGIHTKWSEGTYSDAQHNWTKLLHKGNGVYHYELVIEGISKAAVEADANGNPVKPAALQAKDIDFTIYASYPYLTDDNTAPDVRAFTKNGDEYTEINMGASVRRRANGVEPLADTNYDLSVVSEATPVRVNTQDSGMSGVADAITAEADDAEYFTLQGVRVEGELTPGIYLRRAGANTSKVVIR